MSKVNYVHIIVMIITIVTLLIQEHTRPSQHKGLSQNEAFPWDAVD